MVRKQITKEEEDDFDFSTVSVSTAPTFNKRASYFLFALLVSAAPLWVYHSIFSLSFESFGVVYLIVTLISSAALTTAYHNGALWLKNRLTTVRENVIRAGTLRKDESRKKKVLESKKSQQAEATEQEATAFSILYTDLFFIFSVLIFAFYIFRAAQPSYNYVLSIGCSTALVTFVSSATLNA